MSAIDRRSFLRAATAATLATGAAATAAYADASPMADVVNEAVQRVVSLRRQMAENTAAQFAAEAKMPAWATPGPSRLLADGTFDGPEEGWPLDQSIEPPRLGMVRRTVRINPYAIRADFHRNVSIWCGDHDHAAETRAKLRVVYRARMRRYLELRRAQIAEQEKVGFPALRVRGKALLSALIAAEDAITDLSDEPLDASVAGAKTLIGLHESAFLSDALTGPELRNQMLALRFLRPALTGPLAGYVDEVLSAGEGATLADMSFGAGA